MYYHLPLKILLTVPYVDAKAVSVLCTDGTVAYLVRKEPASRTDRSRITLC